MKITTAVVALTALTAARSFVAAQNDTDAGQSCVVGAFALEFSGSCTGDAVVAAYAAQVFDAPGGRSKTCAADASAGADLAAKLTGAGLADATALCDNLYAAQDKVPFTDAAKRGTDLHFEKMFFDGRTDWQEEVETNYETENLSATSILKKDAEQVRIFYDGIAQGRRVEWPGSLSNFQSGVKDADDLATCTTNAAMCCWPKDRQANDNNGNCASPYDNKCVDKDVADNTNLCFVDTARGNASTGFDSTKGLLVYPSDNHEGEGSIHCHGIAWSNDVNDHTARYKANNLFFVSMYDHMHNRGYVQNIPGAPMCGCVEQMPTVSRSDCTQVDLTETIKITYDPTAETPFQSELTHIDVDFNACQGINNRNNDLWAYIARLYYQGDVTPAQFGEAGRIITNTDCFEATKYQLNDVGLSTGYDHDVAKWTKVAGRDSLFDVSPLGTTAFNTVFFGSSLTPDNPVIYRVCPHCKQTHRNVYYRRLTAVPAGFGILDNILRYYSSSNPTGNTWKTDFTLHSTYDDAVSGASPWGCHNNAFNYRVNFVGDCSPSGARVTNQYTNFWWSHGPQRDVAYYVNAPEGAGVDDDLASAIGLGAQYSSAAVGAPKKAGRVLVRQADDAIILSGGGADIWGSADQFQYVSQSWTGDVDVRVHVSAFTGIVNSWAKAGLMLRADVGNQATHAYGLLSGNQGVSMHTRRSMRANSNILGHHKTNPYQKSSWLRLVKIGVRVTFYSRNNEGDDWVERASDTVRFPHDTYRVGLAVVSHHNDYLSEAVFEDYTVEQPSIPTPSPTGSAGPTAWDSLVYVGGAKAGSITTHATNGVSYYRAYGSGIWGTSDSFLFNNVVRKDTADGAFDVVAYSNRFHTGYRYAKAGIMIRDSNDADAAYAFVGVSGYYLGVTFQTRAAVGESTVHHSTRFVHAHKAWMRLSKPANSNIITSYYKVNAMDTWIKIGSDEIDFKNVVHVGTAVTSGEPSGTVYVDYQEMGYEIIDSSKTRKLLRA